MPKQDRWQSGKQSALYDLYVSSFLTLYFLLWFEKKNILWNSVILESRNCHPWNPGRGQGCKRQILPLQDEDSTGPRSPKAFSKQWISLNMTRKSRNMTAILWIDKDWSGALWQLPPCWNKKYDAQVRLQQCHTSSASVDCWPLQHVAALRVKAVEAVEKATAVESTGCLKCCLCCPWHRRLQLRLFYHGPAESCRSLKSSGIWQQEPRQRARARARKMHHGCFVNRKIYSNDLWYMLSRCS